MNAKENLKNHSNSLHTAGASIAVGLIFIILAFTDVSKLTAEYLQSGLYFGIAMLAVGGMFHVAAAHFAKKVEEAIK